MNPPATTSSSGPSLRQRGISAIGSAIAILAVLTLIESGLITIPATTPALANGPADRVAASTSWNGFGFDPARSGVNPIEFTLGPTTINNLVVLWHQQLPAVADGAPAYQFGRLYFTTKDGRIVAVDPTVGNQLWSASTSGPNFTTSSPVLDPSGLWVYSYGLDGAIHKYGTMTGQEVVGAGWPVRVTNLPEVEKGSSSLNLANGRIYVTTSGYPGDAGHYNGHVVSVDLANGSTTVFNALCSNVKTLLTGQPGSSTYCSEAQAGIWGRAGAVVDPTNGNVFIATGNGAFNGETNWGDSVLELSGDLTTIVDSYTPSDQDRLNTLDLDLGSTSPALLPQQPSSSTPWLAVQSGKDGQLRLLNRRNLSGSGHPGSLGGELQIIAAPGICEVLTALSVWTDGAGTTWVFVSNDCGLAGYKVLTDGAGHTTLALGWQIPTGGTSPIVANGVLYIAHNNAVDARDPLTGNLLWSSASLGAPIGGIHWQSPIVVDGRLIISDESGMVTVFSIGIPTNLPFKLYLPVVAS